MDFFGEKKLLSYVKKLLVHLGNITIWNPLSVGDIESMDGEKAAILHP